MSHLYALFASQSPTWRVPSRTSPLDSGALRARKSLKNMEAKRASEAARSSSRRDRQKEVSLKESEKPPEMINLNVVDLVFPYPARMRICWCDEGVGLFLLPSSLQWLIAWRVFTADGVWVLERFLVKVPTYIATLYSTGKPWWWAYQSGFAIASGFKKTSDQKKCTPSEEFFPMSSFGDQVRTNSDNWGAKKKARNQKIKHLTRRTSQKPTWIRKTLENTCHCKSISSGVLPFTDSPGHHSKLPLAKSTEGFRAGRRRQEGFGTRRGWLAQFLSQKHPEQKEGQSAKNPPT